MQILLFYLFPEEQCFILLTVLHCYHKKRVQVISAVLALIVIFSNEILCVKETQEKQFFLAL